LENDGSERENRSKSAAKLGLCAQTAKCFAIFLALPRLFQPSKTHFAAFKNPNSASNFPNAASKKKKGAAQKINL